MAYKYDGKYILDGSRKLYEFDGKYIKKYCGSKLYEFDGKYIKKYCGNKLYEFDGKYIKKTGRRIYEITERGIRNSTGRVIDKPDNFGEALITVLKFEGLL